MANLRRTVCSGPFIQEKNLRIVPALQRLGEAGDAAHVGRGDEQGSALGQYPVRLKQKVHRVVGHVLDDFSGDNQIKISVGIGKSIAFGVEVCNIAGKLPVRKGNCLVVYFVRRAVIGSVYFAVSAKPLQERRDLHVTPQFQHASGFSGRRNQGQRSGEARDMFGQVFPGVLICRREVAQSCFRCH